MEFFSGRLLSCCYRRRHYLVCFLIIVISNIMGVKIVVVNVTNTASTDCRQILEVKVLCLLVVFRYFIFNDSACSGPTENCCSK